MRQSTGNRILEQLLGNDAMEPVAELAPSDIIRKLASPVGRLTVMFKTGTTAPGESGAYCTASLIDRDLIITNHHCVPGRGNVEQLWLTLGYLKPRSRSGVAQQHASRRRPALQRCGDEEAQRRKTHCIAEASPITAGILKRTATVASSAQSKEADEVKKLRERLAALEAQMKQAPSAPVAKSGRPVAALDPAPKPVSPPVAAPCTGVEVDVAGSGKRCLNPKDTFQDCSIDEKGKPVCGPEMVVVPAGCFTMGSPKDEPHEVGCPVLVTRPEAAGRVELVLWERIVGALELHGVDVVAEDETHARRCALDGSAKRSTTAPRRRTWGAVPRARRLCGVRRPRQ